MPDSEFDVIVVGGGLAGSSAAYVLVKGGANVLLVDRAEHRGTKTISGGILWGDDLAKIIPGWAEEAPVERNIVVKRVGILTETDQILLEYRTKRWEGKRIGYSVLRVKFDEWLLKKVEEAGAMVINGSPIENLAWKDGRVIGVVESGKITTAKAVVIADGANSRIVLNERLGGVVEHGKNHYPLENMGIGIKEVYKLKAETINERFNVASGIGVASEYLLSYIKNGVMVGGFLYTNKASVSIGVVVNGPSLKRAKEYSFNIIEDFKVHPMISSLLEGGELVEYSAHMVPEGGPNGIPKIAGNGYLVAGDAAGFAYSNGLVIQGMNYAIRSGIVAGETLLKAKKDNWSSKSFMEYINMLRKAHVLGDIEQIKGIGCFSWNEKLHHQYPYFAADVLYNFIGEYGEPKKHMREIIKAVKKKRKISYLTMARDALSWGWKL